MIYMKIIIPLSDVNTRKMCPVCGVIYDSSHNFCPREEEAIKLIPIEIDIHE